jgi:hypothetical protein
MNKDRYKSLVPDGTPRYLRCYTNEGTDDETLDCITVVFTKKRVGSTKQRLGDFMYIATSSTGAGFYQHDFSETLIDRPNGKHLGKKIGFTDLTADLQSLIMQEYLDFWG